MARTRAHRSGWKPSSAARGYGAPHVAERKRWVPIVKAGGVACAKCGQPIILGMPWDLGHTADRSTWTGPEHRRCNRQDGARRGNRLRVVRGLRTIWQKQCAQCAGPFETVFPRQLVCGKACADARRNARPRRVTGQQIPAKVCTICGSLFAGLRPNQKVCGPDCRKVYNNESTKAYYHSNPAYRASVIERSKVAYRVRKSREW